MNRSIFSPEPNRPNTNSYDPAKTLSGGARLLLGLLLLLLMGAGSAGCLRFQESDFDATGAGLLWPLLFVQDIFVLGQTSTTTVEGIRLGFQRPRHMAIVGNRLLISDEKNRRVLIWNSVPASLQVQPDIILGAPDASTGGVDAYEYSNDNLHINDPTGIASDGTRLFIADSSRHRVLVWNTFPTASYTPADLVLGQPDFTSGTLLTTAANTMNSPQGVAICGTQLFVADSQNHRVMGWNTLPTTTQKGADFVLGQTNFVNNTPLATGATTLNDPVGIHCDATRLYVADRTNNRVLIWNTIPSTTSAGANIAVGQVGLAAAVPQTLVNGLSGPQFVYAGSNNKLYVSDTVNNRLLIYDPIPGASGPNANVVLGQNNFTNNVADNTSLANGMEGPAGVLVHAGGILLLDSQNNRMMRWSSELPSIFQAADTGLGQPDLTSQVQNNAGLNAANFRQVIDVAGDDSHFFVSSDEDNRVVGWSSLPGSTLAGNLVLGQPDFSSHLTNNGGLGPSSISTSAGMCIAAGRLYMADADNHRVLVWNTVPTVSSTPADIVLGQANFTTSVGAASQTALQNPFGVNCDSQRLIVSDTGNNRVMIWNTHPGSNNQPADLVLGQANFTANAAAAGATGLNSPRSAFVVEGKLIVADANNHRVLIWNTIPTTNGAAADLVIGQADFTSITANGGGTAASASVMHTPAGLEYINGALLITELFNHRITIYRSIPTSNGQAADLVFGQPDFAARLPNNGGLNGTRLNVPYGMYYSASTNRLYIADVFNYRVLALPVNRLGL